MRFLLIQSLEERRRNKLRRKCDIYNKNLKMQREEILQKGNEVLSELEERVGATVAQNALDNVRKEFEQALKAVITAVT